MHSIGRKKERDFHRVRKLQRTSYKRFSDTKTKKTSTLPECRRTHLTASLVVGKDRISCTVTSRIQDYTTGGRGQLEPLHPPLVTLTIPFKHEWVPSLHTCLLEGLTFLNATRPTKIWSLTPCPLH